MDSGIFSAKIVCNREFSDSNGIVIEIKFIKWSYSKAKLKRYDVIGYIFVDMNIKETIQLLTDSSISKDSGIRLNVTPTGFSKFIIISLVILGGQI